MPYRFTDGSSWSQRQNGLHHMDPSYAPAQGDEGKLPDGCLPYRANRNKAMAKLAWTTKMKDLRPPKGEWYRTCTSCGKRQKSERPDFHATVEEIAAYLLTPCSACGEHIKDIGGEGA